MAHGTAQDVAGKWARNGAAAGQDYVDGISRVTQSPTAAAAAAADTWQARVQDPATKAKFQRKLNAVSLDQWKTAATQYGQSRFTSAFANKQNKFQQAIGPVLSYIDNGLPAIKQMPKATFEDRLQRSQAWQRYMHQYAGQG